MCAMLKLRTFIDLQAQSSTHPAPPETPFNQIKHKASPFPFMYAAQVLVCVCVCAHLHYGGLFFAVYTAWVRMAALMHA